MKHVHYVKWAVLAKSDISFILINYILKEQKVRWLLSSLGALFTNPRRAIDGIRGSFLSEKQGEALRMLRAVLLWDEPRTRPLPSSTLLSCLNPVWERKGLVHRRRAGRLPGTGHYSNRSWEITLTLCVTSERASSFLFLSTVILVSTRRAAVIRRIHCGSGAA